mmetsp:Transcript_68400/g.177682  ORF Transcript_68400/g.177682 Transcript_68400/m.177682 type:complete len:118 (-) Transcript_68400:702-1055(-)
MRVFGARVAEERPPLPPHGKRSLRCGGTGGGGGCDAGGCGAFPALRRAQFPPPRRMTLVRLRSTEYLDTLRWIGAENSDSLLPTSDRTSFSPVVFERKYADLDSFLRPLRAMTTGSR